MTLHAAMLRSPHAHADIEFIDYTTARAAPGRRRRCSPVADVKPLTSSLVAGVRAAIECWPIAVDRVCHVGEPVAVVVVAAFDCARSVLHSPIAVRAAAAPDIIAPVKPPEPPNEDAR